MIQTLLALILMLAAPQETAQIPEGAEPLPPSVARTAQLLDDGNLDDMQVAVETLLATADKRVLPYLAKVLRKPERDLRPLRQTTAMGIVRNFPNERDEFFFDLLEGEDPTGRETAAYVLGFLEDPRVIDTLASLILGPDDRLSEAATFSLVMRGVQALQFTKRRVIQPEPRPVPQEVLDRFYEVRRTVAEFGSASVKLRPLISDRVRIYADRDVAATFVAGYRKSLTPEDAALGDLIERVREANRHWLGKPVAPAVKEIRYTLATQNVLSEGEPWGEMPIRFTPADLDILRTSGLHLDRATALDIPLDILMTIPSASEPRIKRSTDSEIQIHYQIPITQGLRVAVGAIGRLYSMSVLPTVAYGIAVIDPERAVPLSDQVYDGAGNFVGQWNYGEYQKLADGSWVPRKISVDLPAAKVGESIRHMGFDWEFQVDGDVWVLSQGTGFETDGQTSAIRALVELRNLEIVRE